MSDIRKTAEAIARIKLQSNRRAIKGALTEMTGREPSASEMRLIEMGYLMGAGSLAADIMEAQNFINLMNN
jgi:hypothetical protein